MPSFKRILVAVDGSETSDKALKAALDLAHDAGGRVRVLHSLELPAYIPQSEYTGEVRDFSQALTLARDAATRVLDDALEAARTAGVEADSKLVDASGTNLGDNVADAAKEWRADLIVVGTYGRRGVSRLLLGSGAEQVIRLAPTPVLVIRAAAA